MNENEAAIPVEPHTRTEMYLNFIARNMNSGPSIEVEAITITQNGTTTAPSGKAYSPVVVNVPNTYAAGDEGKVVSNGALVAQTAYPSTITENDTYDTTNYNSVTVNVSGGGEPEYYTATFGGSVVDDYYYELPSGADVNKIYAAGDNVVFESAMETGSVSFKKVSGLGKVLVLDIANTATGMGSFENAIFFWNSGQGRFIYSGSIENSNLVPSTIKLYHT